jgi:hypothetical protein
MKLKIQMTKQLSLNIFENKTFGVYILVIDLTFEL